MPWQQTEHRDFRGGENLADNAKTLRPNEIVLGENVVITGHAQAQKRLGMSQMFTSAQHPARIDHLSIFRRASGEIYRMVVSNREIRLHDGTVLRSGLSEGPYGQAVFADKWLLVDGTNYYESDGTAAGTKPVAVPAATGATLAEVRRCNLLLVKGNRVWAAGDSQLPHTVYYSQSGRYDYFKGGTDTDMAVAVGQHDGQPILIMTEIFGGILIGKPSGWWLIEGDPGVESTFRVQRLIAGQGPIRRAYAIAGSDVWYIADDGIRILREIESNVFTTILASHQHTPLLKAGDLSNAVMVYFDDRILISYKRQAGVSEGNDFCSLADLRFQAPLEGRYAAWTRITGWNISALAVDRGVLWAGTEDGKLVRLFDGSTDLGEPITLRLWTPEYSLGDTFQQKIFAGVNLEIAQTGTKPVRPVHEVAVGLARQKHEWQEAFVSYEFDSDSDWNSGTHTDTKAENGQLKHANPRSTVSRTEDSQADFGQGTLVRTKATTNGLELEMGGMWVAVGVSGTILTSPDGVTWTSRSSGTTRDLWDVAHNGGMWVAVGDGGTILTSTDGITWTARSSGVSQNLRNVAYGGGMWVVVGSNGTVLTSPDGINWTARSSGTTQILRGVAHNGSMWVVVGYGGTILTSADGINWTSRSSGTTVNLLGIAYGGGMWVAVGERGVEESSTILTSPDGINWTARSSGTTRFLLDVAYGGGQYVVVGNGGTILTSPNGINWTTRSSGTTEHLWGVAYNVGMWVVLGDSGTILTSADGINWMPRSSGTTERLWRVAYDGIVGHRIAPALDLTPVRVVDSSQVTWQAVQPRAYAWEFLVSSSSGSASSGTTYGMKFRLNKQVRLSKVGLEKGTGTNTFYVRIYRVSDRAVVASVNNVVFSGAGWHWTALEADLAADTEYMLAFYSVDGYTRRQASGSGQWVGATVDGVQREYWDRYFWVDGDAFPRNEAPSAGAAFGIEYIAAELPANPTTVTVEASTDNGQTWFPLTNGGAILAPDTDVTGTSLLLRQNLAWEQGEPLSPILKSFEATIVPKFPYTGEWESPEIDLAAVGRYQDSVLQVEVEEFDGEVAVYTRVSLDGGNTWSQYTRQGNGEPIAGLNQNDDLSNARLQIKVVLTTNSEGNDPTVDLVAALFGFLGSVQRHFALRPRLRGTYIQHRITDSTPEQVTILAVGERWRPTRRLRPGELEGSVAT